MSKRVLGSKRAVIVFLFFVFGLFSAVSAFGSECQVITISSTGIVGSGGAMGPAQKEKVTISPEKLTLPVGSCSVWVNFVMDSFVMVSFRENAVACQKASATSTGFFMDQKGDKAAACYITEQLPYGKTSSITWREPGVYKYTVELRGSKQGVDTGKQLFQGVIEVK